MKINYVLQSNPVSANPDDCKAIVINKTIYNVKDIIMQITDEGSILKQTECNAVIDAFLKKIGHNLAEGICFNCDYFTVEIDISGSFLNDKDEFDASRHVIYIKLKPGKTWKESLNNVKPEKVVVEKNKPKLNNITDLKTKTTNISLSPGGIAEINGNLLKIDTTAEDEGIFLIPEDGNGETKVNFIHQNYPKSLLFEVPEVINNGNYRIEVRNRAHRGVHLRTGELPYLISIS